MISAAWAPSLRHLLGDRQLSAPLRQLQDRLPHQLGHSEAHRALQPLLGNRIHEAAAGPGRVRAHQHFQPLVLILGLGRQGELDQRRVQ